MGYTQGLARCYSFSFNFLAHSFHSGCSYIGVITIQHSPEGSRCKIQSATKQDLTPKLPYVEAVKPCLLIWRQHPFSLLAVFKIYMWHWHLYVIQNNNENRML